MPWKYCAPRVHHRRFPFNQNFRNFRNSGKWYRNFPEKFEKSGKRLNFRNASHSTDISGNFPVQSCTDRKLPGKLFENLGIPREVVLFYGNLWKCCSIRNWKFPKIQQPGFWWNEKRPIFPFEIGSVFEFWNLPISLNLVPRSHSVFSPLAVGDLGTRLNFTLTRRWKINTENFLDANKKTVSTFW